MSQKPPSLQSTKDYTKFELCQFNRSVEKTKNLCESMKKHGYIPAYPIHCVKLPNGKLQIKGGHHRFEVAQELGIAVFYVVSSDDATIHEIEDATNPWTQRDYLESFVNCGYPNYVRLKSFHKRTKLPIGVCVSMLSGESASSGNNKGRKFRTGEFVITEDGIKHAEMVADVVAFCGELGIKSLDAIFVQAISRCLFVPQFSVETFKRRCEANVSMFRLCRSVADQTELFEMIYNRQATVANRLPLAFLTNQVMMSRNAVAKHKKGGN
jgi:hypothetical protein